MKTEAEIREKYKLFAGNKLKEFNYEGPRPMIEWVMHQDIGWRNALAWVLEESIDIDR